MKRIKGKLGLYAKEREEFEQKKKELEEEMNKGKQNMEKIRRGMRMGGATSFNETDDEISIKRTKSWKVSNRPDTSGGGGTSMTSQLPVPTGPKISDWCYNGSIDSSPPILKGQEMYEEVRFLGRGSYGTVDLMKNKEENKLYAAKTLVLVNSKEEESILNEVKYLRQYRHPFIINIHDVFICSPPRKLYIILHYCEGGDLGKVIALSKKNKTTLQESQIVRWMTQIGLALLHLHSQEVIHRDIKPVNILLTDNGEVALLADFGLATTLSSMKERTAVTPEVGTPYYTSPEMINNDPCDMAIDYWAFGVCLFELISLSLPFDGESTVALVRSILQEHPNLNHIPSNFSRDLISAIENLLIKDPKQRWNITTFLLSPAISSRITQIPSSYRPKYLEERLRRYHVRQMSSQIEKLDASFLFSPPSASRQVSRSHFDESTNDGENSHEEENLNCVEERNVTLPAVSVSRNPVMPGIALAVSTNDSVGNCVGQAHENSPVDRNLLKNFKEVSISNIALCYPAQGEGSDIDDSCHGIHEESNMMVNGDEENIDLLATSRVNALEQADNYLRKRQQAQQPSPTLDQPTSSRGNKSPYSVGLPSIFDSVSEQGTSSSTVTPSPRPPLHSVTPAASLSVNTLIPGAPTSARNPSNAVSPLTRGRTNLSAIASPSELSETAQIEALGDSSTTCVPHSAVILTPMSSQYQPNLSQISVASPSSPEKSPVNLPSLNISS